METVNVAAVCLNQTPLDWDGNKRNILNALAEARSQGAQVVLFPELCISGYGCEDAFLSPSVLVTAQDVLAEILPECQGLIAVFGLPVPTQSALYNTAAVVADGKMMGFAAKQFLALEGIHYEPRWFDPWKRGRHITQEFQGQIVPFGDLLFDFPGLRFGIEICHDAWVVNRPANSFVQQGANLVLNLSASHFAFGKLEQRKAFVLDVTRSKSCSYVLTNLMGNEAGRAIYDGGALFASNGKIQCLGPRFSYAPYSVSTCQIDLPQSPDEGAKEPSLVVSSSFEPELPNSTPVCAKPAGWEGSESLKEEELARAVSLGLFDYLRKSRSRGFVVSLSGGVDSSSVASLCSLMVDFGVAELGFEGFIAALAYLPELSQAKKKQELTNRLLTCAYQGTRNSSDTTRNAARELAKALGATFHELGVDSLVDDYTEMISSAVGEELSWEDHDLALQNIQARVRGPSVWFIANLKGALLLATSNRSEVAVGYCTMDGDTCGGLSPIAGVDKTFLRQWLRWLETEGPDGFEPIPVLRLVNEQEPTAELRPQSKAQTDEADLMPYSVLDCIEELAIRDRLGPIEVFDNLKQEYPNEENQQLGRWVERFFKLWSYNQWKRERYAPCFHLDDENLDPKTWCRFPILSGGFSRELSELREYIETLEES